ncbi:MAG: glycosyltransferase family 39 protein [Candidatus Methylomirabilota bacterium]
MFRPERILVLAEASHARACGLLLLLSLLCFLPGFVSLQPMDRDEPRFAQASKQMLETGDFIDIRFQNEVRYKKPVGIHWMQSAVVAAAEALGVPGARTTMAVYRIPSLAGALAAVLLTYWAALSFAGRRDAFLAAALLAGSVILSVEARLAKTDAMLLACSAAAMGALARAFFARREGGPGRSTVVIFWAAMAAGVLIKGPMILMFAGACAAVLSLRERSAAWLKGLRPVLGLLCLLAAVLPWFVAIGLRSGAEFYAKAVGDDLLGKVATGQQHHWGPPGFYLVAFFATFWPAAIFAAMAAPFAWRRRGEDRIAFALAWIVPSWLIFEVVSTKLPHYVMPLYPAVAVVAALALAQGEVEPRTPMAQAVFLVMPLIPVGLALLASYAAWSLDGTLPYAGWLLLVPASALAILAWAAFARAEATRAALLGICAAALLSAGLFGLTQPVLQSLKLSPRLAAAAQTAGCPDPRVATLGYREPSLVFLVGTALVMAESAEETVGFLRGPGCRIALVDSHHTARFAAASAEAGLVPQRTATVAGFNINGGRRVQIDAFIGRP